MDKKLDKSAYAFRWRMLQVILKITLCCLLFFSFQLQGAAEIGASSDDNEPLHPQQSVKGVQSGIINLEELAHFSKLDANKHFIEAAYRGQGQQLLQLVAEERLGVDVNRGDEQGYSVAHILAEGGYTNTLIALKKKGLTLSSKN